MQTDSYVRSSCIRSLRLYPWILSDCGTLGTWEVGGGRKGKVMLFYWMSLTKATAFASYSSKGQIFSYGNMQCCCLPDKWILCAFFEQNWRQIEVEKFLDCMHGYLAVLYQKLWEREGALGVVSTAWISICWFYWLEQAVKDVCPQNCWRCKQYFKLLQAARYCIWTDWKLKCWYQKLN